MVNQDHKSGWASKREVAETRERRDAHNMNSYTMRKQQQQQQQQPPLANASSDAMPMLPQEETKVEFPTPGLRAMHATCTRAG